VQPENVAPGCLLDCKNRCDIHICMPDTIYPLRLSAGERQHFGHAAKAEGLTLAAWLRNAATERAKRLNRRAAILGYADHIELSEAAESNPKAFIRKKLEAKRELYR
jgi:hypothetical protein